jgi:hypothetical protein
MDVKVNTKMINDLNIQHELLKTGLEATDAYLGIEKQAVAANKATPTMIHDFTYHMSRAHDALQSLGVLDQHQEYMTKHVTTMSKLLGDDDNNLGDMPYAHLPAANFGEMGENKEFWDSAKSRADMPHEKLSPAMKAKAKARATAAGRKYPNMVDNVWAAHKQEAVVISFANFLAEKKEAFSEDDITEMVDSLTWEDIVDLYPEEDLIEEETEQLDEKISAQSRLKRRQSFARGRTKRSTAKGIKLRRASTPEVLNKRAQLAARRAMYQRLLRGRDKASLSASEKDRVEQQVKSMKNIQASIAVRMVPKMRSIEQKRLAHYRGGAKR